MLEGALRPKLFASAHLDTPAFKALAKTGLVNDAENTYAYAEYSMADKKYKARLGITKKASGASVVYTPIAAVEAPGKSTDNSIMGWRVSGTVTGDQPAADHHRYQLNAVKLHAPAAEPVQFDGEVAVQARTFRADVRVAQGKRTGSVKAELRPVRDDFKADVTLENNVAEWANGRLAVERLYSDTDKRHDLVLVAGRDAANSNRRLEVHHSDHRGSEKDASRQITASFKAPFVPIEAQVSADLTGPVFKSEASATVGKHKAVAKFKNQVGDVHEVVGSVQVDGNKLKADVKAVIDKEKTKLEFAAEVNGEAKADLEVEYERNATPQKADVKVAGSVRLAKAEEAHKYVDISNFCSSL